MYRLLTLSACLWGPATAATLAICSLYISCRIRFVQLRRLPYALFGTLRRLTSHRDTSGVSPFEALCTAIAGTVGTGNIAGVAAAISMGGPGAVFWMWVSAFLGMGLKYAEVSLAVRFRRRSGNEYVGGPMYYIKDGLGPGFRPMAVFFALSGAAASFGLGNLLQLGSVLTLLPSMPVPPLVLGALAAIPVYLACRGGASGRGRVLSYVVPVMAGVYILACLGVICANLPALPGAVSSIFHGALSREALLGGAAGSALSWGLRRGLFSSEAGLGSSPIAHASQSSPSSDPGLMGIFEVFTDTVLICTLTALTILTSGVPVPSGAAAGAGPVLAALATLYGKRLSGILLTVSMCLFAFSSTVSWSLYGERCLEFLLPSRPKLPLHAYRAAFALTTLLTPLFPFPAALALSDTASFFMLATNLLALMLLSKKVIEK